MEKILVISWFFPPCNLTAAQRSRAWAEYFHKKDIYPIIVTRNWDIPIKNTEDASMPCGTDIRIEKYSSHEVHILPFHPSIFSKLLNSKIGRLPFLKYPILLFSILFEHFFTKLTDCNDLFNYVIKMVRNDNSYKIVLITGAPFHLFKLGYILAKDFNLKFVADYRDAWTDNEIIVLNSKMLDKLKRKIDVYFEKKWLHRAVLFSTVSEHLKELISNTIQKEGIVVYNGYFEDDFVAEEIEKDNTFTLVYSGSLYYKFQSLKILSDGINKLTQRIKANQLDLDFKLIFLGSGWDFKAKTIIEESFQKCLSYVEITSRMQKSEASKILVNADCYLMISYKGSKGIVSSKLFEYLYLRKPILNAPSDNDIVESITSQSGLGISARNGDEVCDVLWGLISKTNQPVVTNSQFVNQFSRENQTLSFAEKLKSLYTFKRI